MTALIWEPLKGLKKNKSIFYFFLFAISLPLQLNSQNDDNIGILFYNVENLFDTENDSIKLDDEFTPEGDKHWTYPKYYQKLKNISRVIYESGAWNPPAIVGLCEVENKTVLNDLIWKTGLNNLDYHIIHHESPDTRGIDVAILYRKNIFEPLESIPVKVNFGKGSRPTRDILYTYGLLHDTIPLHVFVAHFPSRYGGVQNTKPLRYRVAEILNDTINNILIHEPDANIIAMGDFNDNPDDESMQFLVKDENLVNLSHHPQTIGQSAGTIKHEYEWAIFDQFFVTKNMCEPRSIVKTAKTAKTLDFPFLLEEDRTYTGFKPFRTYIGYKFNAGYSDHFPVWLELRIRKPISEK